MIRSFLSKALQPPEEQAVINALESLQQLVSLLCPKKFYKPSVSIPFNQVKQLFIEQLFCFVLFSYRKRWTQMKT